MSLTDRELDELLRETRGVAREAGALLLEGLTKPKQVTFKGAIDLVTQYDLRAETLIRERLEARFPYIGMLAEESEHAGQGDGGTDKAQRWIVDPLDGTTNFLHGHLFFAVSIGLEDEGALVAGVVEMPALGLTMWARRGGGAFLNGEPVRVSSTPRINASLLATGFPYDRQRVADDNTKEFIAFMKRAQGIRRCGVAAIDLAFVARGIYDGFWEPKLYPWDIAAGIVLVQEAGGHTTDYTGGPVNIEEGWIVASNAIIHPEMLAILKAVRGY
ncbi:MAG: inositol monophosphatase family protein [Myxococcota bacterium]|nr:inositol monophosphatase family protein [Myxococcota bacterium]